MIGNALVPQDRSSVVVQSKKREKEEEKSRKEKERLAGQRVLFGAGARKEEILVVPAFPTPTKGRAHTVELLAGLGWSIKPDLRGGDSAEAVAKKIRIAVSTMWQLDSPEQKQYKAECVYMVFFIYYLPNSLSF